MPKQCWTRSSGTHVGLSSLHLSSPSRACSGRRISRRLGVVLLGSSSSGGSDYLHPRKKSRPAQGDGDTPCEMTSCALESISYAEAVGDLTDADRSLAEDDGSSVAARRWLQRWTFPVTSSSYDVTANAWRRSPRSPIRARRCRPAPTGCFAIWFIMLGACIDGRPASSGVPDVSRPTATSSDSSGGGLRTPS